MKCPAYDAELSQMIVKGAAPSGTDVTVVSIKRQVAVEECPQCGGYWLDAGELLAICSEYPSEKDRIRAADEYFEEVFGPEFRAQAQKDEENLARARRVANMFRFICPSYYIPGEQSWGAF